ncbi:MerR family transcriptional regulator [Acinetobacter sp. C26M]|uniref:MerR family transcriptional regulator n=1 Tax=unclassified Acinetobacter TaxID=196816 RepID=UPI0020368B5C|nr:MULTISPECIES: MerR family transcriptional regulator [unclassified Acinetobacter]USA46276.1 MerR family transcriptional regulator [Acinetobacter sp. C26M]USA49760.1 MerR family transcriptional regulator [Acinetobacter sp. C26G]
MNLAKVAKLTQVSPRMLRYYENLGLVQPKRTANNYRDYSQKNIEDIHKIKILNDAGMNLKDIQVLLSCFDLADRRFSLCSVVLSKLENELKQVDGQLSKLQRSHDLLKSFLDHGTVESNT